MSIIKPNYMEPKPTSRKKVDLSGEEPAIVVNRQQLMKPTEIKKEVSEKIEKRKSLVEVTTDEEYQELFNMVNNLVLTKDYWEIVPDATLQTVYAFVALEMKKKGIAKPRLPAEPKPDKKED